jgi:hypothetical protein
VKQNISQFRWLEIDLRTHCRHYADTDAVLPPGLTVASPARPGASHAIADPRLGREAYEGSATNRNWYRDGRLPLGSVTISMRTVPDNPITRRPSMLQRSQHHGDGLGIRAMTDPHGHARCETHLIPIVHARLLVDI